MSKVKSVNAYPLSAPLEQPFGYSQAWVESRETTLVRIETDNGLVGWGECWGPAIGTPEIVTDFLGPEVIGRNPLNVERIYDDLYKLCRAGYQSTIPLPAISGIDLALWDIKGKLIGVPVHILLGGKRRDAVDAYATGHYFKKGISLEEQYEAISDEAQRNEQKFDTIKLKTGLKLIGYGYEEDLKLVERVREDLSDDTTILVDANYAYDLPTAVQVGQRLEELGVYWFEEPVPPEQFHAYERLGKKLDIRVAAGECHTPAEISRLMMEGAIDTVQPDLCNVGGITPSKRILTESTKHGINMAPHVWGTPIALAASLQLIATIPSKTKLEYDQSDNPLRTQIAKTNPEVIDGQVQIPETPGIGVEVNENAIDKHLK
ncbi:mandelate racemase/muconate lactonizing enzyme family protein [Natrialbaceae archaeon A-CW3]